MADEKTGHPLDRQNEIERAIQLEGSKDPDNFKMPDGRTLSEVRAANQEAQDAEYQKEVNMLSERTREQSIQGLQKGDKLVMTEAGNIIDVTEPVVSEDPMTMAKSRTTSAEIKAGAIKPLRERAASDSPSQSGETASSDGAVTGTSSSTQT